VIEAEYDLGQDSEQVILVLVEQPGWLGAKVNLRYYITEAVNSELIEKVEYLDKNLISYESLSGYRSDNSNFSRLSKAEIGRALGADMVLLIMLEDYKYQEMANTGYYKSYLAAESVLVDTVDGSKIWPDAEETKSIKVGFEIGSKSEAAAKRLSAALTHCVVRYLYDCPKNKFKISADKSDISWQIWGF